MYADTDCCRNKSEKRKNKRNVRSMSHEAIRCLTRRISTLGGDGTMMLSLEIKPAARRIGGRRNLLTYDLFPRPCNNSKEKWLTSDLF